MWDQIYPYIAELNTYKTNTEIIRHILSNLVPSIYYLTAPPGTSEEKTSLSLLAPGGSKMRDPGNKVDLYLIILNSSKWKLY